MMESDDISLPEDVEYVDAICLDKGVVLRDGCTTATLTTVDGDTVPVTLIVSEPLDESTVSEAAISNGVQVSDTNDEFRIGKTIEKDGVSSVYSIHYLNTSKIGDSQCLKSDSRDILLEDKSVLNDEDSLDNILENNDIEELTSVGRIEDFMDIVTTYKCKFCRFSCQWKSGLMSHIRCCHMKEKNCIVTLKAEKNSNNESKETKKTSSLMNGEDFTNNNDEEKEPDATMDNPKLEVESENEQQEADSNDPLSKNLYLCGQCSDGFDCLIECRQHMMKEHNLMFTQDLEKPVRKRGRPRTRPFKEALPKVTKKRVKKDPPRKERKMKRNPVFNNLEDEYDCHIKRRLHSGYVNDRAFKCTRSGCGHRFTTDFNLNYHHNSHSNSEKPFVCQECHEEFDHWRALALHLWRAHTIDIDLHSCTECNYKTFSFFKLDNHRKIHSEERAYVCETCGKGFKQISQLRNHIVIHLDRKNLPEKRWYSEQECAICNRKFSDTKCLRKHQQAVHSKLKPYVCTFCGHLSARKAMLELHMRQHTGEKPFMCEHCDYRTGDHNSLRRHRMRHTGDKPYKCPHCPYACIQAISYKTHLRNKHPGMEGLFSCNLCSFKSVSRENYVHHMADHKRRADSLEDVAAAASLGAAGQQLQLAAAPSDQGVQMQLTDAALQQLEGILPGNITAAQLIYSCLSAISQDGGGGSVTLPGGISVNVPGTSADPGSQTITIQLPQGGGGSGESSAEEPYYFTIQQDGTTVAVLEEEEEGGVVPSSLSDVPLDCNVLGDAGGMGRTVDDNAGLVIANIESLTATESFTEMMQGP